MPTPIALLMDPATLTLLAMFAALALWERLAPGRPLPAVPGWAARALASFAVYFLLSSYLPLLWGGALAPLQAFDLSGWPHAAAVAAGVLALELAIYAFHRAMHTWRPLWLALHQMHHSAERLDAVSAWWFSPLDMVGFILVPGLVLTVAGLPPEAVTHTLLIVTFLSMFQHTNVRTPRWLGYLVQRPESHSVHHQRGVHHHNFADLPVIDWLFGTFRNPAGFAAASGFWDGASRRIVDMLRMRDVSGPPRQA